MQPNKAISNQARLRTISRWARGGVQAAELEGNGLSGVARRGLASATQPHSAQSIVEFMLVSIPLLALIFGIMEFSLAYFESTTVDFVTRDVARSVQICASGCDVVTGTMSAANPYKDYYALKTVRQSTLDLKRLDYVLIQHVGEETDTPVVGQIDYGRKGPDIYANYQYHYQLYAMPNSPVNSVVARALDPDNLLLADATPGQVGLGSLPQASYNSTNDGYRSAACVSPYPGTCRKASVPLANEDGSQLGSTLVDWSGRHTCDPTDRFYVQLAFRHYWITPFMPTVSTTGMGQSIRGFNGNDYALLSSKVYEKVEPSLFSGVATC